MLNACNAGQFIPGAVPIARVMVARGIPAVVAAQASVTIEYAREFAAFFYTQLVRRVPGQPLPTIGSAVTEARRQLSNLPSFLGSNRRHWALPVLTLGAPMEQILAFTPATLHAKSCEVIKRVFERPGRFVNRTGDRWSILSRFVPPIENVPSERVVILEGRAKAGKGWLALRIARDFLDSRFLVRYSAMANRKASRTSLDVLNDWRGLQDPLSPVRNELPGGHFQEFDRVYAEALASLRPELVEKAFTAFKAALQSARNGRKVLLILDYLYKPEHATVPEADFRQGLMEQLFLPLQNGSQEDLLRDVHALIVAREGTNGRPSDFDAFGLAQVGTNRVKINFFDTVSLTSDYLDEFVEFSNSTAATSIRMLIDQLYPQHVANGSPEAFGPILESIISGAKNQGTL